MRVGKIFRRIFLDEKMANIFRCILLIEITLINYSTTVSLVYLVSPVLPRAILELVGA